MHGQLSIGCYHGNRFRCIVHLSIDTFYIHMQSVCNQQVKVISQSLKLLPWKKTEKFKFSRISDTFY